MDCKRTRGVKDKTEVGDLTRKMELINRDRENSKRLRVVMNMLPLRGLLCLQVEMVGRQLGMCLESTAEVSAGDVTDNELRRKITMFGEAPIF